MNISEIATKYLQAGLSVLPIRPDGSKAPDLPEWKTYQQRVPTIDELLRFRPEVGVAVVAGAVSGNLELYDFDDAESFTAWSDLVETHLGKEFFARFTIVKTPRPGFHVYTRCDEIAGNTKLAQIAYSDGQKRTIKTLIETKGEGGYVLAPGCPGACHETGRKYEVVQGSFGDIPRITVNERAVLMSCARSFNQVWREDREEHRPSAVNPGTPGAEFCQRATWAEVLKPHGFKTAGHRGEAELWTRPGKEHGVSASTNHAGSGLFYPFSTNCYPFDSERGYNKFAVYTLLNHNGDFHAAAKELSRIGYGDQRERFKPYVVPAMQEPKPEVKESDIVEPASLKEPMRELYRTGLKPGASPGWSSLAKHWTLRKGEWTLITGIPSHGKSGFMNAVMMNLAMSHGWKWGVFSAESLPHELHIADLMEQYTTKPFNEGFRQRISPTEHDAALNFIQDHFRFIAPPENEESLERILLCAEKLSKDMGYDAVVVDPWNELNHSWHEQRLSETEYISRCLKQIHRFAIRHNVHVVLVAHPTKLQKDREGKYPIPTPYDVSGSGHWRNKADCALCVWRDESKPGETLIYVQKIRRRFVGRIGKVELRYDVVNGRYSEPPMTMYSREPGADDQ